eukprot:TRINITY_DN19999_c0_g1_i1.p1 TRINITY_DN19999_c0_g1~~TRINITY_DN19999_c0_g1_i1.p1  ORF type:complete len:177 (-),score=39.16 TRINITY_DN19999_c0_g1_i1:61-591(-)
MVGMLCRFQTPALATVRGPRDSKTFSARSVVLPIDSSQAFRGADPSEVSILLTPFWLEDGETCMAFKTAASSTQPGASVTDTTFESTSGLALTVKLQRNSVSFKLTVLFPSMFAQVIAILSFAGSLFTGVRFIMVLCEWIVRKIMKNFYPELPRDGITTTAPPTIQAINQKRVHPI